MTHDARVLRASLRTRAGPSRPAGGDTTPGPGWSAPSSAPGREQRPPGEGLSHDLGLALLLLLLMGALTTLIVRGVVGAA